MKTLSVVVSVLLVLTVAVAVTDAVPFKDCKRRGEVKSKGRVKNMGDKPMIDDYKRRGEVKSKGRVKNMGDKPMRDGKQIKFPDTIVLDIKDLSSLHKLTVKAKRVPATQTAIDLMCSDKTKREIRFENAAFYVGNTGDFIMTVRENADGSLKSKVAGRVKIKGRKCWINDDTITSWDEFDPGDEWEEVLEVLTVNTTSQDPAGRTKRQKSIPTVFEYGTMNVVELVIMVDQKWLSWSMPFIEMFFETSGGQLELVVFGVTMLYPAGSAEWPFLKPTAAGMLQATGSCGNGCQPLLETLKTFLDYHWRSLPQFDHLAFLSGYNITNDAGTGLLGITYSNTVCATDGWRSYKFSIIEDFEYDVVYVFAHELGHALGADHDGYNTSGSCPRSGYMMAAYVEDPTAATADTYWIFSNCTVNAFMSHLKAMSAAGRSCLSPGSTNATVEAFRRQFCSGARGDEYSLDEQCFYESRGTKFAFDADCNRLPTRSDGVTKMAPTNACWDDMLVACSPLNTTGGTCNVTLFHVADGTPCQGSDPNVDYVCFNGDCLLTVDVCAGWNDSIRSVSSKADIHPCDCTNLTDSQRATCCSFKPIPPCCNGCRTNRKRKRCSA